ncbi:hypothetical protein [Streptomyces sp. NPDC013457]|uniref:hypothetical protein n=1 Tax=Streptomyces sp. NPDC013457 TaxID=3364866 RepID=UPI0036F50883
MTDVAEMLIRDGFPVISSSSCRPEEVSDIGEDDGGGFVDLHPDLALRVAGAPKNARALYLEWHTASGWSLVIEAPSGLAAGSIERCRWMGAGLTPDPETVCAFFRSSFHDFNASGDAEQPYYRQPHCDVNELAEMLRRFDRRGSFRARFNMIRRAAGERLTSDDVRSGGTLYVVPMYAGEIAALARTAEYSDLNEGHRYITSRLIADMKARAVTTEDEAVVTAALLHNQARRGAERLQRGTT